MRQGKDRRAGAGAPARLFPGHRKHLYRNYKANDEVLIEKIPFILSWRQVSVIVMALKMGRDRTGAMKRYLPMWRRRLSSTRRNIFPVLPEERGGHRTADPEIGRDPHLYGNAGHALRDPPDRRLSGREHRSGAGTSARGTGAAAGKGSAFGQVSLV